MGNSDLLAKVPGPSISWPLLALFCLFSAIAEVREANGTLQLPLYEPIVGYGLTNAFSGIKFDFPVDAATPPGEANRLFVVERTGRIFVITNLLAPDKTLFLDLSSATESGYLETGLLGIAFHPGYATNRWFYVYRTAFLSFGTERVALRDCLSRFTASAADAGTADPASELVIISQADEANTHNGGSLRFGPDGYLYLSLGFDHAPNRQLGANPQGLDGSFFGGIIRIGVDKRPDSLAPNPHPNISTNYAVPPDNPFIGLSEYGGSAIDPNLVRTEFYAIGLRNPWRFSFDSATGNLFCGDVGEGLWEEIDLIQKGGNYGWPYFEGDQEPFSSGTSRDGFLFPLHAYPHGLDLRSGKCVIGGYVYHGSNVPHLDGVYVFGDYTSGHIWALRVDAGPGAEKEWLATSPGISSFALDPSNGDILVLDHTAGIIRRLVYQPPLRAKHLPQNLSETGAFSDLVRLAPSPGIRPFEVNVPFWSDNAIKSRWFYVPENEFIEFSDKNPWKFPPRTIWIKHFELEMTNNVASSRRHIETRFLARSPEGIYGMTYRWGEDQTNATLVAPEGMTEPFVVRDGATIRTQVWTYPSRADCRLCHTSTAGYALGFNTRQINRAHNYDGADMNQIEYLSRYGYLTKPVENIEKLSELSPSGDVSAPLQHRARSYLDANCAQCHNPIDFAPYWDARISTPLEKAGIIQGHSYTGFPGKKIIKPGDLASSEVIRRLSDSYDRMPPVATSVFDTNAIALLTNWITTLPDESWVNLDIGGVPNEGSASISNGVFRVSGTGLGVAGSGDTLRFLGQPVTGNVLVTARLVEFSFAHPGVRAGLMLRDRLDSSAQTVVGAVNPKWELQFAQRSQPGAEALTQAVSGLPSPTWLQMVQSGGQARTYFSADGVQWRLAGIGNWASGAGAFAGLAISGDSAKIPTASFADVSINTIQLQPISLSAILDYRNTLVLTAVASSKGHLIRRVEFFDGEGKIGEAASAPYSFRWLPRPGKHFVRAELVDSSGLRLASDPSSFEIPDLSTAAVFVGVDSRVRGQWQGHFGREGYLLAGEAFMFTNTISLTTSDASETIWQPQGEDPNSLNRVESGRILAGLVSTSPILVNCNLQDGKIHRLTMYVYNLDSPFSAPRFILRNAATGKILDQRIVDGSQGRYVSWAVSGHVEISVDDLFGGAAVINGIFADPPNPPSVILISPGGSEFLELPRSVEIRPQIFAGDSPVTKVEYFVDTAKIGETLREPHTFVWTNIYGGRHFVSARVTDSYGLAADSPPAPVNALLPKARADFVQYNTISRGNWIGRYGFDGFRIAGLATNDPAYFSMQPSIGFDLYFQELFTLNPAAQQRLDSNGRIAAVWYGGIVLFNITLNDGNPHQVALYLSEFAVNSRDLSVEIADPNTGEVLDIRRAHGLSEGKYRGWDIQGAVQVSISVNIGANAILNGIFLDPPMPLYDQWRILQFGRNALKYPGISGENADPDKDGLSNLAVYAFGGNPWERDRHPISAEIVDGTLVVSIPKSEAAPDITILAEESSDLITWTPYEPVPVEPPIPTPAVRIFQYRTLLDAPARFVRVRAFRRTNP